MHKSMKNVLRCAAISLSILLMLFGISFPAGSQEHHQGGANSSAIDSVASVIVAQYAFVAPQQARTWLVNPIDSLNNPNQTFRSFIERAVDVHERDSLQGQIDSLSAFVALMRARLDSTSANSNTTEINSAPSGGHELHGGSSGSSSHGSSTATQCLGRTKKGARCKRMTKSASGYCWQHEP